MSVRPYQAEDLPVVIEIANKAYKNIKTVIRLTVGDEGADVLNPEDDYVTKGKQMEYVATHAPESLFVCERKGRIVGFIQFLMHDDIERPIGEIGNNGVDPDCGEKGVGQEMYQAVFDHMKACGKKMVYVTTGLDYAHAPARRAYQRAGFKNEQLSVTYYRMLD